MKIGLDLTWMSSENKCGGVFQYGMRLVQALTMYTDNDIVAIINEESGALFDYLAWHETIRIVSKKHSTPLNVIIESEQIEVIHTPIQNHVNFTLSVPMLNTLHDLQPFHFPEFFANEEIEARNCYYKRSAEFSERVIVSFQHVKDDIVKFYNIPEEKIDVCFLGMPEIKPVTATQMILVKQKYKLPEQYLFYSANTWPHKNHIGLLRGVKLLHERHGIIIPLICTGYQYPEFFAQIDAELKQLGLINEVSFLGYLPEEDMPAVLSCATLAVIPTFYEAGSYPLMEAMVQGVPVICSATTSLPDTIGDTRFVFDPNNPEDMAEKMALMLVSDELRLENIANSMEKVSQSNWKRGVESFESSYRKAINDFTEKKKNQWYTHWATNYEFFVNEIKQEMLNEIGNLRSVIASLEAEKNICFNLVRTAKKLVNSLETSLSWRITRPLRWLGDLVRKI